MHSPRVTSLEAVLQEGESQALEFKADVPPPIELARDMVAFANSGGGTIVVGLDDRMTRISPVSLPELQQVHERACELTRPPVDSYLYPLDSIRGRLICIDVEPSRWGPVSWEGVILRREGQRVRAAETADVLEMLPSDQEGSESNVVVAELLAEQGRRLEEIRGHQVVSSTWKRRLPDLLVGGLIGAVISVALSAVFG